MSIVRFPIMLGLRTVMRSTVPSFNLAQSIHIFGSNHIFNKTISKVGA